MNEKNVKESGFSLREYLVLKNENDKWMNSWALLALVVILFLALSGIIILANLHVFPHQVSQICTTISGS